jgi:hypothetical protein
MNKVICEYDSARGGFEIWFGKRRFIGDVPHFFSLLNGEVNAYIQEDSRIYLVETSRVYGGLMLGELDSKSRLYARHRGRYYCELYPGADPFQVRGTYPLKPAGGLAWPVQIMQSPERFEMRFGAPVNRKDHPVTASDSQNGVSIWVSGEQVTGLSFEFSRIVGQYPFDAIEFIGTDFK